MDWDTLGPQLIDWGVRVVGVLVALFVAFRIAKWLGKKVTKGLTGRKFDETLAIFFGTVTRWLILLASILACLSVFGIETTSFAAILGAAGLAIGLGFQGSLAHFAAGVMLLVFRPFKVGDYIKAAGSEGTVKEIGLFTVTLDTPDNRRLVIPNSAVTSGTIENVSHHPFRRVQVAVGTDYSANLDETRQILETAAASVPGRDEERGHQVVLDNLGGSSIDWLVRVWCPAAEFFAVKEATTRAVKNALDEAGIGIPFPQLDVHLDK